MIKCHWFFKMSEASHWICLSVVLVNSVFKMGKDYYFQMFLEECKYIVKEVVTTEDLENLSNSNECDEENFDGE